MCPHLGHLLPLSLCLALHRLSLAVTEICMPNFIPAHVCGQQGVQEVLCAVGRAGGEQLADGPGGRADGPGQAVEDGRVDDAWEGVEEGHLRMLGANVLCVGMSHPHTQSANNR